jgi:hypothetical protein
LTPFRQRFEAKFGTALSADSLGQFVATLSHLGLLQTQGLAAGEKDRTAPGISGEPTLPAAKVI